jgi:hypothetical protein
VDLHPSDPKGGFALEDSNLLLAREQAPASGGRAAAHVEGPTPATGRHADAARVIAVLVGDDDGGHALGLDLERRESPLDLPSAESGIHKETGVPGLDQERVSAASASQRGYAHVRRLTGARP